MKKITGTLCIVVLFIISCFLIINSCKKDDEKTDCPEVSYIAIDQTISEAQQLYNNSFEGNLPGQYPPGAKDDLQAGINASISVRNKECVTQTELDNSNTVLIIVINDFKAKKIPDCPSVDYTLIDQTIADAQQRHDSSVEGTNPGEYLPGAKADLQNAIDAAQAIRDKFCVTQGELDGAVNYLQDAIDLFESRKVIDPSQNLVAHWLFNGDASDASGNGHHGTVSVGHPNWGSGFPVLDEDRHGNENYCYKFSNGGNIVIAQDPSLNPPEMTILTWIKIGDDDWAHRYFISNDIWNCWKFQVQDANKPFFTRKILKDDGTGENAWIDKDSNTGVLELDIWTHIAMSYKSGEIRFYINGVEVAFWDDFPTGTPVDPNPAVDFCIGQALPTGVFSAVPGDPYEWKEWLGYFRGYLDDIRIYSTVLDEDIIYQIYEYEKNNTVIN